MLFRYVLDQFQAGKRRIRIPGGVGLWTTTISLIFIGLLIIKNTEKLVGLDFNQGSSRFLIASILFSLISIFLNASAWKYLLAWIGFKRNKLKIIEIFLTTNLLKYLPGGVWHFVERVRVIKKNGGGVKGLLSVLLEPILMIASAMVLVPLGGFDSGFEVLCFFPIILFHPRLRGPLLRMLHGIKAKDINKIESAKISINSIEDLTIDVRTYPILSLVLEILFILFRFAGFWLCLMIFPFNSPLNILDWLAVFSISWSLGLIIPGAPGGMGIFESSVLLCLGLSVANASLIACLICYRLVVTFTDLLAAFLVSGPRLFQRLKGINLRISSN